MIDIVSAMQAGLASPSISMVHSFLSCMPPALASAPISFWRMRTRLPTPNAGSRAIRGAGVPSRNRVRQSRLRALRPSQPSLRQRRAEVVHNVQAASMSNAVLVVGMSGNPFCKRARKALDAAGVDSAALFAEAGLDIAALADAQARYPVARTNRLWQLAVDATGDPAFALTVARQSGLLTFHALGYSLSASATLREAFERLLRYFRVVSDGAELRFRCDGARRTAGHAVDFSQFGEIETKPLARIRKISAAHLHRSWLNVPHVTQTDEADITELE
eukprot:gene34058-45655_t